MKKLFKYTHENTRAGKTRAFISDVDSNEDAYVKVNELEDSNFFPQEDGKVLDSSGNEVFDPKFPTNFDFHDYHYDVEEFKKIEISSKHYQANSTFFLSIDNENIGSFSIEYGIDSIDEDDTFENLEKELKNEVLNYIELCEKEHNGFLDRDDFEFEFRTVSSKISNYF